jgi:hypothetical protein
MAIGINEVLVLEQRNGKSSNHTYCNSSRGHIKPQWKCYILPPATKLVPPQLKAHVESGFSLCVRTMEKFPHPMLT